jgi:predicted DNA-binding transcriptional regulator YafY
MKIDRLFSIVHILLNRGKVTAKELADEFEVSTRTIYRDIDSLSMSGIPIYTDKGTSGGISLLDNYVLNKSLVSQEEKNSILLGLEVLQATQYEQVDTAINKLKTLFEQENDKYIEIDFSAFNNETQIKVFEDIKESLKKNQTLEILYKNNTGQRTSRIIDPLKLVFKQQRWYLIAFCHKRQDYRTFRISRILETIITDRRFTRSQYDIADKEIISHGLGNVKRVHLTLKNEALFRVEEEFQLSMIQQHGHKFLTVEFETDLDEWLANYILSYADYLINIEPKELKDKVKKKAEKIINL